MLLEFCRSIYYNYTQIYALQIYTKKQLTHSLGCFVRPDVTGAGRVCRRPDAESFDVTGLGVLDFVAAVVATAAAAITFPLLFPGEPEPLRLRPSQTV